MVGIAKPLLPHQPDRCLPHEHVSFMREDYSDFPIITSDWNKKSFFAGLGLGHAAGDRFTPPSGMRTLPLTKRTAVLSSGVLPFSCTTVFAMVRHSNKLITDMAAHQLEKEQAMSYSILWPDEKFRKRMAEIGTLPSSDAEFADLNWVTKRKRVNEIEKKRKAKEDEKEDDKCLKRRKLLSRLKEYPVQELRSMFPKLNQETEIDMGVPVKGRHCGKCGKIVFKVDGHLYHKCPAVRL